MSVARLRRPAVLCSELLGSALHEPSRCGRGLDRLRRLSLVSFLDNFFSDFESERDGDAPGDDVDMKDGDLVSKSGPNTMLPF